MLTLQLVGCGDYLFRHSDRVKVVYPGAYASVAQPLTIRWEAQAFTAPGDGRFAVFLDRDPMPPGESLDYFDRHDRDRIWVLDGTSLALDVVPRRVGIDPAEQDHHDVTVVLLDRAGRRVGEYAGFAEFSVRR